MDTRCQHVKLLNHIPSQLTEVPVYAFICSLKIFILFKMETQSLNLWAVSPTYYDYRPGDVESCAIAAENCTDATHVSIRRQIHYSSPLPVNTRLPVKSSPRGLSWIHVGFNRNDKELYQLICKLLDTRSKFHEWCYTRGSLSLFICSKSTFKVFRIAFWATVAIFSHTYSEVFSRPWLCSCRTTSWAWSWWKDSPE